MRFLFVLSLPLLMSCGSHQVQVTPPFLSPTEQVAREEGTSCKELTAKEENAPAPDCALIIQQFREGRDMVAVQYPQAANVKAGVLSFLQTTQIWNPSEKFPRMASGPTPGAMAVTSLCLFIYYAFEETIRHETIHALTCMMDGGFKRTTEAINEPKDADQSDRQYIYEITCHNTSDDPFGDGTSVSISGRAGCVTLPDKYK